MSFLLRPSSLASCETVRKRGAFGRALLLTVVALIASAAPLPAQEHGSAETDAARAVAEDARHGEAPSLWATAGKIANFAILVGVLVYFGRKPVREYLATRRTQVRADLEAAETMKRSAAAQIAEMDAKLKALPGELEQLRARGQAEIAAEEQRIRAQAEAERARLLAQAQHEIEQQVRLARRELVEHAASLAVAVAEKKIQQQINDADQSRLVDRYLAQVTSHE